MKVKVTSVLVVILLFVSSLSVMADNDYRTKNKFNDVPPGHWAEEYIEMMQEYGIISGVGDGNFLPEATVTREQFAKMMVLTLGLELIKPSTAFFRDVSKDHWSYTYVETARTYLTGYPSSSGKDDFRPQLAAEREDMAVAIVKGLGLSVEGVDLGVLNQFSDQNLISTNLRPYVAKVVSEGIMIGSGTSFNPRGAITRAEASKLLASLIVDEKVVYDDEKVTYEDETSDSKTKTPALGTSVANGGIYLDWTETDDDDFNYYKVVFSQTDTSPSYPDNGYVTYISDVADSDYLAKAGQSYHGGSSDDVGEKLVSGKTYYVAITAVYDDGKYTSNVIQVVLP
ncbi:MAG: S-layer homology domain-containing protein [Vallitaleaceae bacterium]|nr:S-layer homology domain-containing protein [Vallitaleaceae bacterium]